MTKAASCGCRILATCVALASACGDSSAGHGSDDAAIGFDAAINAPHAVEDAGRYEFPCFEIGPITGAPTFTAVYREIFCSSGCVAVYCHGAGAQSAGLDMQTFDVAYAGLVGAPAGSEPLSDLKDCRKSGLRRVQPGQPEKSLLYLKVSGSAPCGLPMPPATPAWSPLDKAQLSQIRRSITDGAKDDRRASEEDAGL